ncbi:ABC transporter ATP-binding protein [candidate division NPL-UPA2 bacterium]|nr:ABC transporter ATP-binding protein [candidate division NPL-UPA2 bacterium]
MLEAKNISFSYGKKYVLKNIDFCIGEGEITALIGPNGSGKSTLLRCLLGLLPAKTGEVLIKNQRIKECSSRWLAKQVSFLSQGHEHVSHITVWELVSKGRSPYQTFGWTLSQADKEKVSWAIEYMDLASFQHRHLDCLSGGECQRAWIAMVLAQDTELIMLDEPATYLDLKYQWALLKTIREIKVKLNKTFIVVLHDINHAMSIADHFIVLKEGEIVASGCGREIITESLLKEVYDVSASVCTFNRCLKPVVLSREFVM